MFCSEKLYQSRFVWVSKLCLAEILLADLGTKLYLKGTKKTLKQSISDVFRWKIPPYGKSLLVLLQSELKTYELRKIPPCSNPFENKGGFSIEIGLIT